MQKPELPAHIREMDRTLDRGIIEVQHLATLEEADAWLARMTAPLHRTPEQLEAERQYEREAVVYNAWAKQHNAAVLAKRQALENEKEIAAVRAARCNSCFTVHAGECY